LSAGVPAASRADHEDGARLSTAALQRVATGTSALSLQFRLFVWSLIADPLLFFVILDQNDTGVNLTLARVLQSAFLVLQLVRLSTGRAELGVPSPLQPMFRNYSLYVLLLLASSLLGVFVYGSYNLANTYTLEHSSFLVEAIRGPNTRPFFELVILVYYFVYFVVLPKYMIKSHAELRYLFKWVIRVFYVMLAVGLLDVFSNSLGGPYIPKHSVHMEAGYVGVRFHGLAGEPRDAFAYLLFGLAMVYLRSTLVQTKRVPRMLGPLVLVALVMTQSASGVIGLGITAVGVLIYFSLRSVRKLVVSLVVVGSLVWLTTYLVWLSPRLVAYSDAFADVWVVLNAGGQFSFLVATESSNFLPFWNMWLNAKELNVLPVLLGSGLGSTNIINNNLSALFIEDSSSELMNANAQITRIIYESGIIGFFVYVNVFVAPFKVLLGRFTAHRVANFVLFAVLLGASLGHRSSTVFVYLGIVVAVVSNWPAESRRTATA